VALCPAPAGLVAPRPAGSPAHTPAAPGPEHTARKAPTADVGAVPLVEPPHQRRVAQRHRRRPVWHLESLLYNRAAFGCPGMAPISPSSHGDLEQNQERGGDGGRSPWDPSGAQARRDPRPLSGQMALPFFTSPWWAPPQPHRRLRAGDEGRHWRGTMLARSPCALPAYPPRAHRASRTAHLCVPLVTHFASNSVGVASYPSAHAGYS
jgi:hypothetical protein